MLCVYIYIYYMYMYIIFQTCTCCYMLLFIFTSIYIFATACTTHLLWGIGTLPGSNLAFDEGIVRAELPLSRHSGGVVDAVVGKGALHLLSTGRG